MIELIVIGDEVLIGQVVEGHMAWIGQRLREQGLRLQRATLVGDREEAIASALQEALGRSEAVVITGGLGPTEDDRTRYAIARVAGKELILHEPSYQSILQRFRQRGQEPVAGWEVMAMIPQGAQVLPNLHGTAPGFIINADNRMVAVLPGVPSEMRPMFLESVLPLLVSKRKIFYRFHTFYTAGSGEARLAQLIGPLASLQPASIAFLPTIDHGVKVRVEVEGDTESQAGEALSRTVEYVRSRISEFVFSEEPAELEEVIVALMKERRLTLSVAESCTGGMLASRLISVPGASDVFERGLVTYSNRAKVELLGVREEVIRSYGAVSEECAQAMAEGVRLLSSTDWGLSVTGIAGPTGGTPEKPVGLVYIGVAGPDESKVFRYQFVGDRDENRRRSTWAALVHLWQHLRKR